MSKSAKFKLPWNWGKRSRSNTEAFPDGWLDDAPQAPPLSINAKRPVDGERPSGLLPRFHTTASDHVAHDQRDSFGRQRLRLRNAFTPSQPVVDPRMFAGRRNALENVIRAVEEQRLHVVLYGERGVGKTSLLHMLSMAAREARYIVVYLSCGSSSNFSETFRTVASEIPLLYHSAVTPTSSRSEAGSSLADLLPPGELSPRQFADATAKLVGTRVLIVLDEFDRAASPAFRRDVAELIKTLSDLSARLQLVIAGVAEDVIDLLEHIPSIRRTIAVTRIATMAEEEVRALVANGERTSGLKFETDTVERVVMAAKGSPYLVNLLCHLAGMAALDARRSKVVADDVVKAISEAIDELRSRLPAEVVPHLDRLAEITAQKRAGTAAPASDSGGPVSTPPPYLTALRDLESKGLFHSTEARYVLILDTLGPYLQLREALRRTRESAGAGASEGP